jgi:phage gp29-like protein
MATSKILDQHGQPIRTADLREPQSLTSNVWHIATEQDAHPSSGLTPARIHAILQAAELGDLVALQDLADDMQERDGQIFSTLAQRIAAVTSREITIAPPPNATESERRQAADVRAMLDDVGVDLTALATDLLDGTYKGFSAVEQWWQVEGALMAPRFESRQQRLFTVRNATLNPQTATPRAGQWLDPRNELRLRTVDSPDGQALRPYNWVLHRHAAKNGYLAKQLMARVLVWPFILKHYSQRDFAEFLEIYGLPLRLGTYPAGASDADKRTLLRAVTEIGHNAAGIIPSGMLIDFKEAAKGVSAPFLDQVRYQDEMIAKVVLGQTLTSGEGQHGTQALGQVHANTRDLIRDADARAVAGTITRDLLWPFVQFNVPGADPRRMPSVHIDTKDPQELGALVDGLTKFVSLGGRVSQAWAQREAGIPEPAEGEPLLTAPAAPPAPAPEPAATAPLAALAQLVGLAQGAGQPASARARLAQFVALAAQAQGAATQAAARPAMDALDDLVTEMMDEWQPAMAPLVQPLLSELDTAIDNGESADSLMQRLPGLLARMDARALADVLTRAGFVANTAGQAGVNIAGQADQADQADQVDQVKA